MTVLGKRMTGKKWTVSLFVLTAMTLAVVSNWNCAQKTETAAVAQDPSVCPKSYESDLEEVQYDPANNNCLNLPHWN